MGGYLPDPKSYVQGKKESLENRFYALVKPGDSPSHDYVIPKGATLSILELGGNALHSVDSYVKIVFDPEGEDPEILFLTHGDSVEKVSSEIFGDGIKILRITLINKTPDAQEMGAFWIANQT